MKNPDLLYTIDPFDPAGHRIRVTLRLEKPDPKGQTVSLPAWIPGSYLIRDFSKNIETLQARSQNQKIAITQIDSHTWTFAPCKGPLEIETIIYAWDASVRACHFDDTHCFINGTSTFLMPHGQTEVPCTVQILQPPHRTDWKAYSSLTSIESDSQNLMAHYQAPDYDALIDHPIEMGTPIVADFEAHGAQHQFVITGYYPNLDVERIVSDTRKICEAQIELFEPETLEAPFLDCDKRYVFMLTITHNNYGGLEHRASTALMFPRKDLPTLGQKTVPDGYADFLGLVSHEYFHTWHVKRIKPAKFAPYPLSRPAHTKLLWVFEGFTSYYDDLMLIRSGVVDDETYFKQLCKNIDQVHTGPGRLKQSLTESSFDAWTKYYKQDENAPNAIVSYYSKGALAALALDLTIRAKSQNKHCLDDVMRELWQRYGKDFYQGKPNGLPEDGLISLIKDCTGVDVSAEVEEWVEQANDIPLETLLDKAGYTLTWRSDNELPSLDLTTVAHSGQLVIRHVYEGGSAHQAGLASHDKLIALAGLEVAGDMAQVNRILGMYQPGDSLSAHVFRDGVLKQYEVTLSPPAKRKSHITVK